MVRLKKKENEFLARVSHELRNPVTGIVGFLHLLSKTQLDEVQGEYVAAARNGAQVLLDLLNGLLDLSNAESGHLSLDFQPLDLRECLEATATLHAPQARNQGLEMVSCIDPRIPDVVMADGLRLRQVLANLLGNALKFTDSGYVGLSAWLRSHSDSEGVVIRFTVEDSGRGIPTEKQLEIFRAFSQAHREDRAQGAGLGLAICKEIISALGGILGVESRPAAGTTFWFDLHFAVKVPSTITEQLRGLRVLVLEPHPQSQEALLFGLSRMGALVHIDPEYSCDLVISRTVTPLHPHVPHLIYSYRRDPGLPENARYISRPLRLSDLLVPKTVTPNPPELVGTGRAGRVLVVDDDPLCRQLLVALASQRAVACDGAGDGTSALALVRQHTYQMIFVDQNLPDCSGQQLAELIRGQECSATLVSLSGSTGICHQPFQRCLSKPLDPEALDALLQLSPVVDWQVLERYKKYQTGANQSLLCDLVQTYTCDAENRMEAIQQAVQAGQSAEVRRLAHQLSGAASSVGAMLVAGAARSLEQAPEQNALVQNLHFEVGRSLQDFQSYLRTCSGTR
ncbi:response regulator [bacterium]|nr:response regulator [bacterium]